MSEEGVVYLDDCVWIPEPTDELVARADAEAAAHEASPSVSEDYLTQRGVSAEQVMAHFHPTGEDESNPEQRARGSVANLSSEAIAELGGEVAAIRFVEG